MDKIKFVNNGQPAINDTNLNQMQTNIENAINAIIVESGSNANGSYIKWSDGTMICRKKVTGTAVIDDSYYGLYKTKDNAYFNLGDYPVPFVGELPDLSVQFYGGNSQWIGAMQNRSLTHVGEIMVLSVSSKSAGAYYSVIAIGKWK